VAQEHSQCPSAKKGGSLGTFKPGQMVRCPPRGLRRLVRFAGSGVCADFLALRQPGWPTVPQLNAGCVVQFRRLWSIKGPPGSQNWEPTQAETELYDFVAGAGTVSSALLVRVSSGFLRVSFANTGLIQSSLAASESPLGNALNPQPSTLNPQPYTLAPKIYTLNP
jgi:hypothetical protein